MPVKLKWRYAGNDIGSIVELDPDTERELVDNRRAVYVDKEPAEPLKEDDKPSYFTVDEIKSLVDKATIEELQDLLEQEKNSKKPRESAIKVIESQIEKVKGDES